MIYVKLNFSKMCDHLTVTKQMTNWIVTDTLQYLETFNCLQTNE